MAFMSECTLSPDSIVGTTHPRGGVWHKSRKSRPGRHAYALGCCIRKLDIGRYAPSDYIRTLEMIARQAPWANLAGRVGSGRVGQEVFELSHVRSGRVVRF